MRPGDITDVASALVLASQFTFLAGILFAPVTALFWPWWRGVWGWNIVALETCIWVSLAPAPLHAWFGAPYGPVLLWVQVAAVTGAGATLIWRMALIWLTQRAARRGNAAGRGDGDDRGPDRR